MIFRSLMRDIIRRFFSDRETSDGLDQAQREATIDLLLLCMYADNDLDLNEERIINRVSQRFAWKSETRLDDYIKTATAGVLGIIDSEEERAAFISGVSKRLKNSEAKFRAVKLCKLLFYSDLYLHTQEEAFIKEIERVPGCGLVRSTVSWLPRNAFG